VVWLYKEFEEEPLIVSKSLGFFFSLIFFKITSFSEVCKTVAPLSVTAAILLKMSLQVVLNSLVTFPEGI
jgi:hypothetical protein